MDAQGWPSVPATCQRAASSASLSTRSRETSRAGRGVASHGFASSAPRRAAQPQHARAWARSLFAVRADGIAAPLVLDGAVNGESFLAYVRQFLAPALRSGDVLVMDNLPSHKVAGVREAVEAAG